MKFRTVEIVGLAFSAVITVGAIALARDRLDHIMAHPRTPVDTLVEVGQ